MPTPRNLRRTPQTLKYAVYAVTPEPDPVLGLHPLRYLSGGVRTVRFRPPRPVCSPAHRSENAAAQVHSSCASEPPPILRSCTKTPTSGAFDSGPPPPTPPRASVVPNVAATARAAACVASCPVLLGILSSEPRLCPPGSSPRGTLDLSSPTFQFDELGKSTTDVLDHCQLLYRYLALKWYQLHYDQRRRAHV